MKCFAVWCLTYNSNILFLLNNKTFACFNNHEFKYCLSHLMVGINNRYPTLKKKILVILVVKCFLSLEGHTKYLFRLQTKNIKAAI